MNDRERKKLSERTKDYNWSEFENPITDPKVVEAIMHPTPFRKVALVTGGAGFIGSHLIEHIFKTTDWNVVCLDRLDTSGNLNRLSEIVDFYPDFRPRLKFVFHDLKAVINSQVSYLLGKPNYIFHLAASTHVDRSITDPISFVYDNVVGTGHVLEYARGLDGLEILINFGTDEIFGPAPLGTAYSEWDRYKSSNVYSATKAGAEELGVAYHNTYNLPVISTHCMNAIGQRQNKEKYLPLCINKSLSGETLYIHSDKKNNPGTRFYIHARNIADALLFLIEEGETGDKYNITGQQEVSNLELALLVAEIVGKPINHEFVDFHSSRPGHDLRYALDDTKLLSMGFEYKIDFTSSLETTVKWYLDNPRWLA